MSRAVAPRPGSIQDGVAEEVKVRAWGPPGGAKSETRLSMVPLSSKMGATPASCSGGAGGTEPVRPRASEEVSMTSLTVALSGATVPVKVCPASNRRTSRTSRLRLRASMESMPGTNAGRRLEAPSESGFSMGTGRPPLPWLPSLPCLPKRLESGTEAQVLETASE